VATLAELATIYSRGDNAVDALVNKIVAAVLIKSEAVRVETPQPANYLDRLAWVREAFINPVQAANNLFGAILAANASATTAQIVNAADAAIQTAVNNAVESFLLLPPPVTPPSA
jgi:hypothetical protein